MHLERRVPPLHPARPGLSVRRVLRGARLRSRPTRVQDRTSTRPLQARPFFGLSHTAQVEAVEVEVLPQVPVDQAEQEAVAERKPTSLLLSATCLLRSQL